jgi:RNA polymerase sigma-70 factor (ECF subfamily)
MNNDSNLLIKQAINGNKSALQKLIKIQQPQIYSLLFYLKKDDNDLNDLMQEILLKFTKKLQQLKNPDSFKMWLNQIVLNTYYDYLRKNKARKKNIISTCVSDDRLFEIPDYDTNPSDEILNNELDFIIKSSINNLPLQYKIPIALRELQGLTYNEISNLTKTTVGTVKSRIARARARIKDDICKYTTEESNY